jgi:glycosyltransferase involved in cell wall biosynthesis
MRLSVIIPTCNRIEVLKQTLSAMENQTLQKSDFEIIVVDVSTDAYHRKKVLEHQPSEQTKCKVLTLDRGATVSVARNVGAQNAEGEYLLFMDDDMIPALDTLKQHVETHAEANEPLALIGKVKIADNVKRDCFVKYLDGCNWYNTYSGVRQNPNMLPPMHGNSSIAKSVFEKIGQYDSEVFDEYGGEAEELGVRLTKAGVKVLYLEGAVCQHSVIKPFKEFCVDIEASGRAAIKMFRKHPEVKAIKDIDALVDPDGHLTPEKLKMRKLLSSKPESLGMANYFIGMGGDWDFLAGILSGMYDKVLKAHYGKGILEMMSRKLH